MKEKIKWFLGFWLVSFLALIWGPASGRRVYRKWEDIHFADSIVLSLLIAIVLFAGIFLYNKFKSK